MANLIKNRDTDKLFAHLRELMNTKPKLNYELCEASFDGSEFTIIHHEWYGDSDDTTEFQSNIPKEELLGTIGYPDELAHDYEFLIENTYDLSERWLKAYMKKIVETSKTIAA